MKRGLALLLAVGLLALGGCGDDDDDTAAAAAKDKEQEAVEKAPEGPSGPQTFKVLTDGPSAVHTENLVYGAYFPTQLVAAAGDTIVFENLSSHDIHTVSFGVKADRSDAPIGETKAVQVNPAVFMPCFTDAAVSKDTEACPTAPPAPPAAPPSYTGKGYWNSGVFFPAGAPAPMPTKVALELDAATAPGSYSYSCLLHPGMDGEVVVVSNEGERLSPADVTKAGEEEFAKAKASAAKVKAPEAAASVVASGWGDDDVAVDRFEPVSISVKAGDTVTWKGLSPFMPHTVSFEPPFKDAAEPNAFLPAGAKAGSAYTSGVAHSGIFGPAPYYPTSTFSLQFAKAGTYEYVCILHPGMSGTVKVA